jgi:hypothetical protein
MLYAEANGAGLYLRLVIWNAGPREIGVDLDAYADLLHRGEWSGSSSDHQRRVLAIRFGNPPPPPPERCDRALRDFEAGGLHRLAPGASIEVFRKFSSSSTRKVTTPNGTYLAIGANPLLLVTDGERVELVTTSHDESSQRAMDDLARRGIGWSVLPDGARILPVGE